MKLLAINNVTKKDSPIYYRNEYNAKTEFLLIGSETVSIPIFFSIEMAPTGEKTVEVKIMGKIDYPLVPILQIIKKEIISMEKEGLLH
ncbi:hypothetical protein [Spirochaeta isovalerica]|uniref:Uncharacterized protein n=1 Tax=Spirochaeta isovalerica TaxID=150 RepID=A0A841R4H5_9SPIO|nr:hypothetical protein [Spirochaeta isovalerica]MBB6478693.1 hypothetical protein [Spirochaeta isovalerica]